MKICHIFTLTVDTTSEMLSVNMKIFISMFLFKKFHENRMILPETRKYFFLAGGGGGGEDSYLPSLSSLNWHFLHFAPLASLSNVNP